MYTYKELYTLDLTNVKSYFEIHCKIKKELDLPDYYGCNPDALGDRLTDMVGDNIHIEIIGLETIYKRQGL